MTDPSPEVAAGTAQEPLRALIAQWRERARRIRPLEDAPLTAEKRARIAEWMHFTTCANELEAALPSAPAPPQTPRTEAVWLWDAAKDGYWHQGEFVSADQLRWLLRPWPAAPAPPEALLDLVVRLQREEHERACGMRLVFASKGPCKTGWHFTPDGEPQHFEQCQHPDCVLARTAFRPAAPADALPESDVQADLQAWETWNQKEKKHEDE